MEFPHDIPRTHQDLLKEISLQAHKLSQDSFLVGGYVRDFYLNSYSYRDSYAENTCKFFIQVIDEDCKKLLW